MAPAKCEDVNCEKRPVYGTEIGKGRFCVSHKTAEMVDVKVKRCIKVGCELRANFGSKGGKCMFCFDHKDKDMIDLIHKRCKTEGCPKQPIFGPVGGKMTYCETHKTKDMINLKHKRCEEKDCDIKSPCFDVKGGKGRYCFEHKTEQMINVRGTKCENIACSIRANFDIVGGKGRFCFEHKLPKMVNINSKNCGNEGCPKRPNFDIKGGTGLFCSEHKKTGMININSNPCRGEGCDVQSTVYNYKDEKHGKYCAAHKLEGMIDIKTKSCVAPDCNVGALYGRPGTQISHCATHKEKGMMRKSNSRCIEKLCNEKALWGINFIPRYCEIHKTNEDLNLMENKCISCGLMYILDKDSKCENCNPASWNTGRLAKQNALMDYLDSIGLHGVQTDKIIDGGLCGKERPDRIYDFGDKIVILECDENQHNERNCSCEQTRMVNIGQSFGGIPTYFIRWNPDKYKPDNENKKHELVKKRHKLCGDLINDIKKGAIKLPIALVAAIYLYYDSWSSLAETKWQIITAME